MRRIWKRATFEVYSRAASATSRSDSAPDLEPHSEDVAKVVIALESDTKLLEEVVGKMQANNRRRLVVAGGAMEWFGKENIAKEVERADEDKDRVISPKDFDRWFVCALKRKAESSESSHTPRNDDKPIPFSTLALIAIEAGLPFVGFGFLDNATMILAGDAIDQSLGFYLNCSVMASAAMGNVVSGVCGMQVHGLVEKAVQMLNLNTPVLTEEQRKGRRVFLAGHIGGTIGIMTGLTLGMLPLLIIRDEESKIDANAFAKWDTNEDGVLEDDELLAGLKEAGIATTREKVDEFIKPYSADGKLSLDAFKKLCKDLRNHHHAVLRLAQGKD